MALIIEIGGLDSNSYVTVAESDTYLASNLDSNDWGDLTSGQKEQLLIKSTALLDDFIFGGLRAIDGQALSFPRTGLYKYEDVRLPVPDDSIPYQIKDAQCELALWMFLSHGVDEYTSVNMAGMSVSKGFNDARGGDIPEIVFVLIKSFFKNSVNTSIIDVSRGYPSEEVATTTTLPEGTPTSYYSTFLKLTDTPDDYTGHIGEFIRVAADGISLEFGTSALATAWGAITGTLSDQTDLQAVLDTKVGTTDTQTLTNKTIDDYTNIVHADALHFRVKATENILKGQPVTITGWNVGEAAYEVALANQATEVANGLASTDMATGVFGMMEQSGVLTDIDTSAWTEATILYLDGIGALTPTEPTTGFMQPVAYVVRSHAINGALQVNADYPKQDAFDVRYTTTDSVGDTLDDLLAAVIPAIDVTTDTTNFNNNLSATDTDVQKALDTLDDMTVAGGATVWGAITGTLSDQLDLQTALDGKSATTHNHDAAYADIASEHAHANKALLDTLTSAGGGSLFLADDGTYKGVGTGSAAWGAITGTLSDQTDLQTALDGKSATTHNHDADYADIATEHTHTNKTLLDTITDAGAGTLYLADDGIYKAISVPSALEVKDESTSLDTAVTTLNFLGAGVTAVENLDHEIDITIPGGGAGAALEVEDESVSLDTAVTKLNFLGAGVTAVENLDHEIDITIPGGGAGASNLQGHKFTIVETWTPLTGLSAETITHVGINARNLTNNGVIQVSVDGTLTDTIIWGEEIQTVVAPSSSLTIETLLGIPYDLSIGAFKQVAVSVGAQETSPNAMMWNNDGTRLFVMGASGDDINEYWCTPAYDIAGAVWNNVAFQVGGQESNPWAMMFNNDGTKLYVMGSTGDDINEYNVPTPYHLSTGVTFTQIALVVGAQDTVPLAMMYNGDGTKLYVLGSAGDDISEYALSTAYDIASGTFTQTALYVGGEDVAPYDMIFNNDGTKLYISGSTSDSIYEYALSTAYDISTGTFTQIALYTGGQEVSVTAMLFNDNGNKFYTLGSAKDNINEYTLSGTSLTGEVLAITNNV